ncbi:MAG: hypothetical protein Q8Q09_18010 [Deltaproteobacteria bacterium]|nr:hypothetical protein [Deltaproteobacteria bacterium]
MVKRLVLGLLKGLVIGGALGALFFLVLGINGSGALAYVLAGLAAAIAGIFAGQPPWRQGAWVGTILKGTFGLGVGAALYWVVQRFLGGVPIPALGSVSASTIAEAPIAFMPIVAAVYSMLIELDDGGEDNSATAGANKTGVRVDGSTSEDESQDVEVSASSQQQKQNRR